ncbi:MAG TPA: cytochrome c3 family protein [Acidobacteriota bacterium]|nr:cytochrome c3 family protein [Acidobacteriota bacterium]
MLRRSIVVLIWAGLVLGTIIYFQGINLNLPDRNRGFAPKQPIAFSHRVHSGDLGIDCQFCHTGAERTRMALIPDAGTCMNCHRFITAARPKLALSRVAEEEPSGGADARVSPELQKLYQAVGFDPRTGRYDPQGEGEPIRWVRVHQLPDHVVFDHRRHVNAGVDCRQCHGAVETMEVVRQVEDLSMGWCVNCHRDANQGRISGLIDVQATTDCSACHY